MEHIVRTAHGPVSVIVYGDQDKPALLAYPDLALNREIPIQNPVYLMLGASFGSAVKGTGLKALEFAISICDTVDMFGFTVDPGYKEWTRYFSESRKGHTPVQGRADYQMMECLGQEEGNEMQIAVKQKKHGDPVGETLLGKAVSFKQFSSSAVQSKRTEHTCIASLTQNGMNDDLVDDKGFHEDIHTFASNADIVICCLLMNSETGALLVNIARGGLLDYEAILYHLKSGHLGGLGMDVAWTEPFDPEDPILKFPNVLITPHVEAVTEHAFRSMAKVVGNVALQLHAGSPLTGIEFVN
ncbi:unnamed protein product [Camellia sinensis]